MTSSTPPSPSLDMTVLYRGLTILVRGDDPRAQVIARLLFGLDEPAPAAPAAPPAPESAALPKAARDFWNQMNRLQRDSLELLSTGPRRRARMLRELRVDSDDLMAAHSGVNRQAAKHGVPLRVETRGRKHTRFHKLSPEAMELVKRLLKEMPR